jgi:hypothetical protein
MFGFGCSVRSLGEENQVHGMPRQLVYLPAQSFLFAHSLPHLRVHYCLAIEAWLEVLLDLA